jgi:hypothetical protein
MSESSFSLTWNEAHAAGNCESAGFEALAHKYERRSESQHQQLKSPLSRHSANRKAVHHSASIPEAALSHHGAPSCIESSDQSNASGFKRCDTFIAYRTRKGCLTRKTAANTPSPGERLILNGFDSRKRTSNLCAVKVSSRETPSPWLRTRHSGLRDGKWKTRSAVTLTGDDATVKALRHLWHQRRLATMGSIVADLNQYGRQATRILFRSCCC